MVILKTFLFRFDGAQENDAFLEHARLNGHVVYAGLAMTLDCGWVPDFVEVRADEDGVCSLTLIELEATASLARIGARKYLPESSTSILTKFHEYLDRVLQRCRVAADPRSTDIQGLSDALRGDLTVRFWTAGALRQPSEIVERLPLIDQGHSLERTVARPRDDEDEPDHLDGHLLSARVHKNVSRSVLILDAVVRGWDKSDASLRAWRNLRLQPLRREIREHPEEFPALVSLLLGQKTGIRLTINDVSRELCAIWNRFQPGRHSEASVLTTIRKFMPLDRTLDPNASVRIAFAKAHGITGTTDTNA